MASFESDIKKLQKMWEASQANQISIDFTDLAISKYNLKLSNNVSKLSTITTMVDIGGPYQLVTSLLNTPPIGDSTTGNQVFGALLDYKVKKMPEDWIPFVRFNIATNSVQNLGYGTLSWFVETQPIDGDDQNVNAIWHLAYILQGTNIPDFKFKIYLSITSPTLAL